MNRVLTATLLFGLFVLAAGAEAQAQSKESKVRYRDRTSGKEITQTGVIKDESLAGLDFKPSNGPDKKIAATDVIDVEYSVPILVKQDLLRAVRLEGEGKPAESIEQYQKVLAKVTDEPAKRHLEFKIAGLTARLAAADDQQLKPAVDALLKFKSAHPGGWQVAHLPKLLIPLQLKADDLDGAQKTLAEIAALPKVPKDLQVECNVMLANVLVTAKKYGEAEKRLQRLINELPADDPQRQRLQISLAECLAAGKKVPEAEKMLQAVVAKASSPDVKAAAYNTLGDCFQQAGENRKAMWNYLFVHVLYHQNKEEHARALYNLYKVFKELKDDKKAEECRETLEKDKTLAGKYQDLLQKDK